MMGVHEITVVMNKSIVKLTGHAQCDKLRWDKLPSRQKWY